MQATTLLHDAMLPVGELRRLLAVRATECELLRQMIRVATRREQETERLCRQHLLAGDALMAEARGE
jgi:hypothetical protein